MDLEKTPIGYEYSSKDLKYEFKAIYGAVAWPGERPGFAVVLGMGRVKHFDNYDIYLLDEYEWFDLRGLVRQCGALDYKYNPKLWIGDTSNGAADRLIREMNEEMKLPNDSKEQRKCLWICPTPILDDKQPYQYMLTKIKELRDPDPERRQLFLKESKILNYLSAIEQNEIHKLELGDYPAIQALAFAVIEMRNRERDSEPYEEDMSIATSYSIKTAF